MVILGLKLGMEKTDIETIPGRGIIIGAHLSGFKFLPVRLPEKPGQYPSTGICIFLFFNLFTAKNMYILRQGKGFPRPSQGVMVSGNYINRYPLFLQPLTLSGKKTGRFNRAGFTVIEISGN